MAGYLHLFYEDYTKSAQYKNPTEIINNAKNKIRVAAINKINSKTLSYSEEIEARFQKLYGLTEQQDLWANISGQMSNSAKKRTNAMLKISDNIDAAIAKLRDYLEGKAEEAVEPLKICESVISNIDIILTTGASLGGLGQSATAELNTWKKKLNKIKLTFSDETIVLTGDDKQDIIDSLKGALSNISGYILELAFTYAFLQANKEGNKALLNTGGNTDVGLNTRFKITYDPKLKEAVEKINEALSQSITQTKADAVFAINIGENSGTVESTIFYTGFQIKNYKSFSGVGIGSYDLGKLSDGVSIVDFYDESFLVNVAGGLPRSAAIIQNKLHWRSDQIKEKTNEESQLRQDWSSIVASTKMLGAIDVIIGHINGNMLSNVQYYVIRSKSKNQVRVVGVSKLLNQLLNSLNNELDDSGIGFKFQGSTSGKSRDIFTAHNINAFDPDDDTGQQRSDIAYPNILYQILFTKVDISLNFAAKGLL